MYKRLLALLPCLLLPIAGAVVYLETLDYPFQHDDTWNVMGNEFIHLNEIELPALQRAVEGHHKSRLRPLSNLSFALSYYFGNLNPRAFRSFNIFLHAFNCLLVYLVLLWTLRRVPLKTPGGKAPDELVAGLLTLVWAVHPLHISAVTYIHQRMMLLTSCFFLLGLLAFIAARGAQTARGRRFRYLLCALAAVGSLASKEIGLLFPFGILLYEWALLRRGDLDGLRRHWGKAILLVAVMAVAGAIFLNRYGWYWLTGVRGSWQAPTARLLSECRVLLLYLGLWVAPHPSLLNFEHAFTQTVGWFEPWSTLPGVFIPVALLGAAVMTRKRAPLVCFGILWFLLQLSIEAPLVALDLIAEYRLYLSSLGLLLVMAAGMRRLPRRSLAVQVLLGLVVAGVFATWNVQRNRVWQSVESLWADAVAKNPSSYRALLNHGLALAEQGRHEEALPHIEAAVNIHQSWNACNALSRSLWYLGRQEEADRYLELAGEWLPSSWHGRFALAQNMELQGKFEPARKLVLQDTVRMTVRSFLGRMAATQGDDEQAEYWLRSLVELRPADPRHRLVLARFYLRLEKHAEAVEQVMAVAGRSGLLHAYRLEACRLLIDLGELEKARELLPKLHREQPWNGEVQLCSGRVCELEGDMQGALRWYQSSLDHGTQSVLAWNFLGRVATGQRKYTEAALCYRASLELEVTVETGRNLAAALNGAGEPAEAERVLRQILEFHEDPEAGKMLGVALALQGKYALAIPYLEAALESAPDDERLQKILAGCRERAGSVDPE